MSGEWAASALDWWREAGVDTILDEAPRDWLNARRTGAAPTPGPAPKPKEELPATLPEFHQWLRSSGRFPPGPRVPPSGDPTSGLMMLTDVPGAQDAAHGTLVSGETGAMFDRMLERIGRSRETIYLASMMPVRPATGRLPPEGVEELANIARHHIALVRPTMLLLFGDECSKALLGAPMAVARGRPHALETAAGPIKTIVTMSLQFLFSQPRRRKDSLADLRLLMEGLEP